MAKELESLVDFSSEQLVDWDRDRCIKFKGVTVQYAPLDLLLENAAYQEKLNQKQTILGKIAGYLKNLY